MQSRPQSAKTTLLLFSTAIIWGFAFVAQVLGSDYVAPFTFTGLRFLLGAVSLLPVCLIFERETGLPRPVRRRQHHRTAVVSLLAGFALFMASTLQQFGTSLTRDPGKAGFITGLYTVFTPILYFLIFRKRTGIHTWIACLLAATGLYLICLRDGTAFSIGQGEVYLLLGSLMWAVHILIVDRFVDTVSPLRFSAWQFFAAGVFGMAAAFILEDVSLASIWQARWALLFCGVISVGVAYTIQILGQRTAAPTQAAIIFSTESIFATVGGFLWNLITPEHLHVAQDLRPIGYLGAAFIFAGVILSQFNPFPVRHPTANDQ